jgi:large subunit ribosomal protein L15
LLQPIKILSVGEVTKKLTVQAHRFSKSAADKITKAGGSPEILS